VAHLKRSPGIGWHRFTGDALVTTKPALLHGVVILTSTTGGDAALYEGQDADSGRIILTLEGIANTVTPVMFPRPLYCERGLYLDVGSNVTEVLVAWEPAGDPQSGLSPAAV